MKADRHCGGIVIYGRYYKETIKAAAQKQLIIECLTDHVSGKSTDFMELLGVKSTRTKKLLAELINAGIVVPEGDNRNRVYKLKS